MTDDALAKIYSANLAFASKEGDEKPSSPNSVNSCIAAHRRLLQVKRFKDLWLNADEAACTNPFDSVWKLMAVSVKAKTEGDIEWSIELIFDLTKSGAAMPDQISIRCLVGELVGQQRKGLIGLCVFRKHFLCFLMATVMNGMGWDPKIKIASAMRHVASI